MKTCSKCGAEKPVSEFHNSKNYVDGLNPQCKECRREYHLLNKERENARSRKWKDDNEDSVHEYRVNYKQVAHENYEKNKDAKRWARHEYYVANKEKIRARQEWRKANDYEYVQKVRMKRHCERYRTDVQYKLGILLRGRLRNALNGKLAGGHHVYDLGCSIDELKEHLESLFTEGMSWNNHKHDGWHIDHIKPLVSFDLTDREQLLVACNYKNLQPLWARDNMSKGDKIEICEEDG